MKLLHVSDTHIGATLRGASRLDEMEAVLQEIADIATNEGVAAVLHTGDLFDSKTPSPAAQGIAADWLRYLGTHVGATIVISGNHDSAALLGAYSELWGLADVTMVTEPRVLIGAIDFDGDFDIIAIPFVYERAAMRSDGFGDRYHDYAGYMRHLIADLDGLTHNGGRPSVAMMHATIDGGRVGVGERPLHLGEAYTIAAEDLPAVNYVALGHLHRAQEIEGRVTAHYAGSPIQLDFGEAGLTDRTVNLIDFEPGPGGFAVDRVHLDTGLRLEDLEIDWPGDGIEPELADVIAGQAEMMRYRITATCREGRVPGQAAEIRECYGETLSELRLRYPDAMPADDDRPVTDRTPIEAFREYWIRQHGDEIPEAYLSVLSELLDEAGIHG